MLIWFKKVAITNCTLSFVVALLGATVCADTRDTVSSVRHIASTRRGSMVDMVAASAEGMTDEIQVR